MNPLNPYHWLALAAIVGALILGVHKLDQSRQQIGYDKATAEQAVRDRAADVAEREKETKWQTKIDEVSNDAQQQIDSLQINLADAGRAADRLRSAAKIAASRARANPGATAASAPASDPISVLADVLVKLDERAGIYAEAADRSRIAGVACVQAYEALTIK